MKTNTKKNRLVNIRIDGDSLIVNTPYHRSLVGMARGWGGDWKDGAWHFPLGNVEIVTNNLLEIFGDDGTRETKEYILTANDDLFSDQAPVKIIGWVEVARAYSRDSGAKWSDSVSVISGKCCSGGSRKNWGTCVEAGSKIRLTLTTRQVEMITDEGEWDVEECNLGEQSTRASELISRIQAVTA